MGNNFLYNVSVTRNDYTTESADSFRTRKGAITVLTEIIRELLTEASFKAGDTITLTVKMTRKEV